MARAPRESDPGAIYHVYNRANRKQTIFRKPGDYRAFMNVLFESLQKKPMRILAAVVMPNHFHLLLWPTEDVSVSTYMHWVTTTHVRRYHAHHGLVGTGHLYQDRFRMKHCRDERGVLGAMRYIEANPLTASLVERAEDWEWGSLWFRAKGEESRLLCPCPITLPSNWTEYVNERGSRGKTATATP